MASFERIYDYSDAPTIKKFNECDKFFRHLQGPLGSGKSSGCVAEIIDRGIRQQPSTDGVRRTKWACVRNCFDDKTEVLTEERGWVFFKDLLPGDSIASQVCGDELKFVKPTYYYSDYYSGEMIGIKSQTIDILVTPDHNMYAAYINGRTKKRDEYTFFHAKDIYGKTNYALKLVPGEYNGGSSQYSDDFFEFLGFWFAEGSAGIYNGREKNGKPRIHRRLNVTQKKYKEYVRELLARNNFKYNELDKGSGCSAFIISTIPDNHWLINELNEAGLSCVRKIPQWIKSAPRGHLLKFLYGYLKGDGHFKNKKNDTTRSWTSSSRLADDIQEISIKCGIPNVINKRKDMECAYTNTFLQSCKNIPAPYKRHWYKQQYCGYVYCVEVPEHVVLVRRNGKVSLSSQTYGVLTDTTMETFFYWLPHDIFGTFNKTEHRYIIDKIPLGDGTRVEIEVLFRALDKPEHTRNLLSLELTGAWFNEMREIPKVIVDLMEGRCNRYPKDVPITWTGIISDTNPPDQSSWLYKFFEEQVPKSDELKNKYEIFKQPSGRGSNAENISNLNGGAKYYTDLAIGKDPEFIKVYIDGEYGYVRDGKPVYPNYMDSIHCAEKDIEPVKGFPIIMGCDFGLSPAIVLSQYIANGKFNVLKEFYEDNMGLRSFFENIIHPYLVTKYRGFEIVTTGDPSGVKRGDTDERSCYMELKRLGYPATPAHTNALLARINSVDNFLTRMVEGKPAFQLSPCCEMLRRGFIGEYKLHKFTGINERYSEVPVKNDFSHPHDALQYSCLLAERGVTGIRGAMGSRYEPPTTSIKSSRPHMEAWT